ncbi:MAG TPA: DUF3025 domain-containing protein [Polyangiales bacterium]|nr:DUF3025 domain-containing protein [Polyangiales bacterium]
MALRHTLGWEPRFVERSPWFWPLSAAAGRFEQCAEWPSRQELDRAYAELALPLGAEPLSFAENVRKADKREGERVVLERLYDGRITCASEVPTRERDWHDFFNALCFMTYPRAKRALHRRQYALLCQRVDVTAPRLPPARTPEQDALTLFDEGGAVIAAEPEEYQQLMAAPEYERTPLLTAFTEQGGVKVLAFGHALFEHLVEGLRCPGGSTRVVCLPSVRCDQREFLAAVDRAVAELLADATLFRAPREGAHMRLDTLGLR